MSRTPYLGQLLTVEEVRGLIRHNISDPWSWADVQKVMEAVESRVYHVEAQKLASHLMKLLDPHWEIP